MYIYTYMHIYRYMCITMEYYSDLIKKEVLTFATTWMTLDNIMLSKISPSQRDKFCLISHI